MNDPGYIATREQHAENIAKSANRLAQMCNANMPNTMIERERQSLTRKLILFPVDREAQIACERADNEKREREKEYLAKTDYFADSKPDE